MKCFLNSNEVDTDQSGKITSEYSLEDEKDYFSVRQEQEKREQNNSDEAFINLLFSNEGYLFS